MQGETGADTEGVEHALADEIVRKAYAVFARPGESLAAAGHRALREALGGVPESYDFPSLALMATARIRRQQRDLLALRSEDSCVQKKDGNHE